MRPRIGITTSVAPDPDADGHPLRQLLDLRYVRAVEAAGGLPLPVPVLASDEAAEAFAALLDGLVVIGGPAVERGMVGERPADLDPTDPARTASDERILRLFLRDDERRPVLGICYGMQLMCALRGGRIWADVQAQQPGALVHSGGRGGAPHPVQTTAGSVAETLFGKQFESNTHHVQAIDAERPGDGLAVSGRAPDGVVEVVESGDGRLVGVQFHPERMGGVGAPVFRSLAERAVAARIG
jgi:putative glutamine amidotransferase